MSYLSWLKYIYFKKTTKLPLQLKKKKSRPAESFPTIRLLSPPFPLPSQPHCCSCIYDAILPPSILPGSHSHGRPSLTGKMPFSATVGRGSRRVAEVGAARAGLAEKRRRRRSRMVTKVGGGAEGLRGGQRSGGSQRVAEVGRGSVLWRCALELLSRGWELGSGEGELP